MAMAVMNPPCGEAVVFTVAGQRYALPIGAVQEIQQIVAMTQAPDPAPGVVGLVNLRGSVVPGLDLRSVLGLETRPYGLDTPMVITRTAGGLVALFVDEVEDVVELPDGCLQSADGVTAAADRLLGVCRVETELVFLLDPERIAPWGTAAPSAAAKRSRKKARP